MRILIVDDEPLARTRLAALVAEGELGEVVGEAVNGEDALAAVQDLDPEVVLLDIRMPGMDGLEAARHLATLECPPAVVFTTAYGDHALAAFEAHAVDYLLKPIRAERLRQALERARALTGTRLAELATAGTETRRRHLSAIVHGRIRLVPVDEVRALQADQKYVNVRWPGGQVLIEESLKSLEREFPGRFLRVHRNALAALAYVECLERDAEGSWWVQVRDLEQALAVSRRHLPQVRRVLSGRVRD